MSELKVVGRIQPPQYKDPATMLRNIADEIERGDYGAVETIVVALRGDTYETFSGGPLSTMQDAAFLFASCAARLHNIPWRRS